MCSLSNLWGARVGWLRRTVIKCSEPSHHARPDPGTIVAYLIEWSAETQDKRRLCDVSGTGGLY